MTQFRPPGSSAPGLLLGLGLGGFVDGIVMHQILQWHHLVSDVAKYPMTTPAGLKVNTLADGIFNAATWVLVLAGSLGAIAAWRAGRLALSWNFHVGLLLVGWGLFNLVQGVVDHQVLGIHHVRDDLGAPLSWDLGSSPLGPFSWSPGLCSTVVGSGPWSVFRAGPRARTDSDDAEPALPPRDGRSGV